METEMYMLLAVQLRIAMVIIMLQNGMETNGAN
jgi:hypothetical protein